MKTLFAAFGGLTNSSKTLLDHISCPDDDKLCLKNSFKTAPKQVREKLAATPYDLVIIFGQRKMSPANTLRLETVGRDSRVAYHTEVNFPELAARLARDGFDPMISKDAGRYLCNNIYFQTLKYIDEKSLDAKVIFIHLPKLRQKPDLPKIANALVANIDEKLLLNPYPL